MKIRIKGNSIRFRLTKNEVSTLANNGYLEEETCFANNKFIYAVQSVADAESLSAELSSNKITLAVPKKFTEAWPQNDVVGTDAKIPVNKTDFLYLLLEKDFVCLDETTEDQRDNYENPNKNS